MCDSFFVGPIRFPSCFMFMVLSFLSFCFPCIRRSSLARLFLFNFLLGLYRSYVFSNTYAWAEACTVNQFSMIQKMYLLSEIVTNSMLLLSARLQSNGYANINRYHIIQLMGGKCLVIPLFFTPPFLSLDIFFMYATVVRFHQHCCSNNDRHTQLLIMNWKFIAPIWHVTSGRL